MTSLSIQPVKSKRAVRPSLLDDWARRLLFARLQKLPRGRLHIEERGRVYGFGEASEDTELRAHICIHHASAYRDLLLGGSIGAGEAYMLGSWRSHNLVALVRLMAANIDFLNSLDRSRLPGARWLERVGHFLRRNTERQAKRNIAAHYDLSNQFFSLFLDDSLMYSAAVYPRPEAGLEEAARYKLDLICRKLALGPSDHLLEIGSGWGGLAIHAAKYYGCRVTTTTISRQQYDCARERIQREGLGDRITLLCEDYRQLEGQYDKLVSIEMIEAVGHSYYETYFKTCNQLLKPGGAMLLQAITIPEQRFEQAGRSVDFIQRYIFPGGSLPSHGVIADCLGRYTDMQIVDLQEIGEDYARTLQHWRERFLARRAQVAALGFDESFIRLWEFYLCYSEGGFRERAIGTAQLLLAKPDWRRPQERGHETATG